ncbi:MAG: C40 family peptidase, partial [Bacteroidota bacterium]
MNPFKRLAKLNLLIIALFFVACSPQRKVQQYSYLLKYQKPKVVSSQEVLASETSSYPTENVVAKLDQNEAVSFGSLRPNTIVLSPKKEKKVVKPLSKTEMKASILLPEDEPLLESSTKTNEAAFIMSKKDRKTLLRAADTYVGAPYLFGGNTKKGIDCSGLICQSYASLGLVLPRNSRAMANGGRSVKLSEVEVGNLVFFHSYKGKGVNHVGMVSKVEGEEIEFIHATVSEGVRKDKLSDPYWK